MFWELAGLFHMGLRLAFPVAHRPLSSSFFYGLYLGSYKVIPKRKYLGAYGYFVDNYCHVQFCCCRLLTARWNQLGSTVPHFGLHAASLVKSQLPAVLKPPTFNPRIWKSELSLSCLQTYFPLQPLCSHSKKPPKRLRSHLGPATNLPLLPGTLLGIP